MNLIIVSGLSGSGKSTALHVLEDLGYNCIDNLPVSLLPALIEQIQIRRNIEDQHFAIGMDARNAWQDLSRFPEMITSLQEAQIPYQVIFLNTRIEVLIQRFSETRRKHPLSDKHTSLGEAIKREQALLDPIRDAANQTLDTSQLNLHQLRDLVKGRLVGRDQTSMAIQFESFGFKHGLPMNADLVFDVRCLPNPHWKPNLRAQTGQAPEVAKFLSEQEEVAAMYHDIQSYLARWLPHYQANSRSYITIAIGCTGGQHRSVYLAERLHGHFAYQYPNVQVRHRELSNSERP